MLMLMYSFDVETNVDSVVRMDTKRGGVKLP